MTKGQIISLTANYVLFQLSPKGYSRYVPYVARLLYLQNRDDENYTSNIIKRTKHTHEELLKDAREYIFHIREVVQDKLEKLYREDPICMYTIYNDEEELKEVLKSITNEMEEKYHDDIFLSQHT